MKKETKKSMLQAAFLKSENVVYEDQRYTGVTCDSKIIELLCYKHKVYFQLDYPYDIIETNCKSLMFLTNKNYELKFTVLNGSSFFSISKYIK